MLTIFTDEDKSLFLKGRHCEIYDIFGSHLAQNLSEKGIEFTVWAPHAKEVFVQVDMNQEEQKQIPMENIGSGIWQAFSKEVQIGMSYQYRIVTSQGKTLLKSDPVAFFSEGRPQVKSIIWDIEDFQWTDEEWYLNQPEDSRELPLHIYELHLGSWRRNPDGSFYTYRQLAEDLPDYIKKMGYTHIEMMPLTEHPLDESWGYQVTGYFSPTSRYGTPQDLMYLIQTCHQKGIGVILDWVGGHFCNNDEGLSCFDGGFCYEPEHSLRRGSEEWGTSYFDFGKSEVRSFLISSALYWLKKFHFDGLRMDAVSSMLYLDYKKENWLPNEAGGRENYEAIKFIKEMNQVISVYFPKALLIAEEAETFPLATESVEKGGLGFTYKWNLGWIHDVTEYIKKSGEERKKTQELITFSMMYAFSESFILPLSHDEVAEGETNFLEKMPGSLDHQFANLRLLFGFMMAHPGKKMTFMGQEFGALEDWKSNQELEWSLLNQELHRKMQDYSAKLNHFYLEESSFWQQEDSWDGFRWLDPDDDDHSVLSFLRQDRKGRHVIVICNFSEDTHYNYRIGAPRLGTYYEALHSNEKRFGGDQERGAEKYETDQIAWQGQAYSFTMDLSPFSVIYLLQAGEKEEGPVW